MRILFSGTPAAGHLLPMVPMIDAARAGGHAVRVLSGRGSKTIPIITGLDVVEVGPSIQEAMEITMQRTGEDGTDAGASAIELFGGVRLDGVADEAIEAGREFQPDLVVHETFDCVGPLVAAALGVPACAHRVTGPLPPEILQALADRAQPEYRARSIRRADPIAIIDPFPDVLRTEAERDHNPLRMAIRPEPLGAGSSKTVALPTLTGPVAVVTLGTSVDDPAALNTLVTSIADAGVSVIVTTQPDGLYLDDRVRERVHAVGFLPVARLFPAADIVVSAGGTGTLLAALALGKPLVIMPFIADQPLNAQRAADLGVGVAINAPASAGAATRKILDDADFASRARSIAAAFDHLDTAATVLERVLARIDTDRTT